MQYYVSQKRKSGISIALLDPRKRVSSTTFPRRLSTKNAWNGERRQLDDASRLLSRRIWFEWTDDYTERDIRRASTGEEISIFQDVVVAIRGQRQRASTCENICSSYPFLLERLSLVKRRVQGLKNMENYAARACVDLVIDIWSCDSSLWFYIRVFSSLRLLEKSSCFKEILNNLYARCFAEHGYLWYKSDRS